MFYPEDFKNKVKKEFPSWENLHEKLDLGDPIVGRFLNDNNSPLYSEFCNLEQN